MPPPRPPFTWFIPGNESFSSPEISKFVTVPRFLYLSYKYSLVECVYDISIVVPICKISGNETLSVLGIGPCRGTTLVGY